MCPVSPHLLVLLSAVCPGATQPSYAQSRCTHRPVLSPTEDRLSTLEQHLREHPKDARAWNAKAVLLAESGDYGEALRCLDQAVRLDPSLVEAHVNRGRILLALGPDRAAHALDEFTTALRLSPDNTDILVDRAAALKVLGRTDEELECLQELVRRRGDSPMLWLRIGEIHTGRGRLADAVSSFDKALGLDPGLVPAMLHKAIVLTLMERWRDAVKTAEAATKAAPDSKQVWLTLGEVNRRAERYRAAMKALRRAAEIDPEDATIEVTMGRVEHGAGNLEEAVVHFKRALVRNKKNVTALRYLGATYMELQDWAEAAAIWERLSSITRKDPDVFDALGHALARLSDFCGAAEAWERARKLYRQRGDEEDAARVMGLGRAARINCSRQEKAARERKREERLMRRHRRTPGMGGRRRGRKR